MTSNLPELIAAVDGLAKPDRTIDELTLLATGWTLERAEGLGERATWIDPTGKLTAHRQGDGWFKPTASLDDAMTLVPEGWDHGYQSCGEDGVHGKVWKHGWHDDSVIWADATTPAIALAAAALRARLEEEGRGS